MVSAAIDQSWSRRNRRAARVAGCGGGPVRRGIFRKRRGNLRLVPNTRTQRVSPAHIASVEDPGAGRKGAEERRGEAGRPGGEQPRSRLFTAKLSGVMRIPSAGVLSPRGSCRAGPTGFPGPGSAPLGVISLGDPIQSRNWPTRKNPHPPGPPRDTVCQNAGRVSALSGRNSR